MGLRDEILEQPAVVGRLVRDGRAPIDEIGRALHTRAIDNVVIAARGTSDHAAICAQYVFGVRHRLPVARAAPSILSLYGVTPRFGRSLVIGISQSGASPDIVGIVAAAKAQGAPTVAITNDPSSALATAAEFLIDVNAGPERAVAATKTCTGELTAVALLSAALSGDTAATLQMESLPDAISAALLEGPVASTTAAEFRDMATCTVIGRGYEYATVSGP